MRTKELTLVTILLMCTTVFICTWKRTPLLSTLPGLGQLELNQDTIVSPPADGLDEDEVVIAVKRTGKEPTFLGKKQTENEENRIEETENRKDESEHEETKHEETENEETRNEETKNEETGKRPGTKETGKKGTGHKETRKEETTNEKTGNQDTEIAAAPRGSLRRSSQRSNITACNYAKGKWVVDRNHSTYSGFGCKQWLSWMWACRLTQRTDFSYEKLRWQPKDCELEKFEGSKFLKRMQNKTLAFVGDSLGRQQFQSLMCMITGGNERDDIIDVGDEYGIAQAHGNARTQGLALRFPSTNTTIIYYWSASLCYIEPMNKINQDTDYAMHLDRPDAFLIQNIHKFNVLVLNTAHHWNRGKLKANRWIMHVGGALNTDKNLREIWKARNLTVHSVISWANSQLPKYPNLKVFYRSISPRHFVGGEWNTGGSCDNTTPMSVGKEVVEDESSDPVAASAVKGTGVKLLDITALSKVRDEAHISRFRGPPNSTASDCLHWCLPGVPDTWNEILFAQL